MSIAALQWAMALGKQVPDHHFRVLVALADCHSSKRGCFPSIAHLEDVTGKGRSTIFRILDELEAADLITRQGRSNGNGRLSNLYHLAIDEDLLESHVRDVSPETQRPTGGTTKVPRVGRVKSHVRDGEPELNLKENLKPPISPPTSQSKEVTISKPDLFEEFWLTYPRKAGKGAAKKAWKKAIKLRDPSFIISALQRKLPELARAKKSVKEDYRPYPASWLNKEMFEDPEQERDRDYAAERDAEYQKMFRERKQA